MNHKGGIQLRILHVLANSSPDTNGYAIRSHMILKHQANMKGIEVEAITSPWYPHRESMVDNYDLDGIHYQRVVHPARKKTNSKFTHKIIKIFTRIKSEGNPKGHEELNNRYLLRRVFDFFYYGVFKIGRLFAKPVRIPWKVMEEKILMKYLENTIITKYKSGNIEVIHAHTPYRVGLPALRAARKLGIPFVYEMRGMWEETAVANGRWRRNGPAHRRFKRMENKVLTAADSVITISETLKEVAIERGVDPKKIVKITNGVEEGFINDTTRSTSFNEIKQKLSSKNGSIVVGYIGSLREMEGVDFTAKAVGSLVRAGKDVKFFCLGGEAGQVELRQVCSKEGIAEHSLVAGPVPHNEVPVFYDLIDIFVVSRPDYEVTRKVTPLKPFEAMGRGRTVVVSNLDALTEIVQDGVTGVIVESNDVESLSLAISELADNPGLRNKLGLEARSWIRKNRLWKDVIQESRTSYQIALNSNE